MNKVVKLAVKLAVKNLNLSGQALKSIPEGAFSHFNQLIEFFLKMVWHTCQKILMHWLMR